jgi:hypothetical protein
MNKKATGRETHTIVSTCPVREVASESEKKKRECSYATEQWAELHAVLRSFAEAVRRPVFLASAQTVPKRPCTLNASGSQHATSSFGYSSHTLLL